MEIIEDNKGKAIGAVDKIEGPVLKWAGIVLMPNHKEDKEKYFKNKAHAIQFVKNEYKKAINQKPKPMATRKKPTPAQLAARKRFAEMAKNGTLAKKRAASAKKPTKKRGLGKAAPTCTRVNADGSYTTYTAQGDSHPCPHGGISSGSHQLNGVRKPAAKKRGITAKKLCSKIVRRPGIKVDGTLMKGWHYVGGKPVKATAKKTVAKKPVARKKPIARKKPTKRKKVFGIF